MQSGARLAKVSSRSPLSFGDFVILCVQGICRDLESIAEARRTPVRIRPMRAGLLELQTRVSLTNLFLFMLRT